MEFLIKDKKQLEEAINKAYSEKWVAIDTESAGPTMEWLTDKKKASMIDAFRARLVGWSFAFGDEAYYVPVGHVVGENVDAPELLRKLLAHPGRTWAHNWKWDARAIKNYLGEYVWPPSFGDTMVLSWLTGSGVPYMQDGDIRFRHGLKDLALHHFGHKMASFHETVNGKICTTPEHERLIAEQTELLAELHQEVSLQLGLFGDDSLSKKTVRQIREITKQINQLKRGLKYRDKQADECTPEELGAYAADDARQTLALAKKFGPILVQMDYVKQFDEIEMACVKIVRDMEDAGISIDVSFFEQLQRDMQAESERLEKDWEAITGSQITSSRQAAKAVYEDLKAWEVTDASRTSKGQLSVNKKAIAWVMAKAPEGSLARKLAELKEEHSKKYKIANTYTHAIIRQIPFREDGRLHAEINQIGTETGRFSSNNPNLQAMPRELVRKGFVAPDGMLFCDGDWSNLEVVILAHYTRDPNLLEVILGGKNLHSINQEILGVDRTTAKAFYFGWSYGAHPKKLATILNKPLVKRTSWGGDEFMDAPDDVHELFRRMNKAYETVVEWRKEVADECRLVGYVTTFLGHRRYLPQIKSRDKYDRLRAERAAANAIIQGTAAGIAKAAMVSLTGSLGAYPGAELLLQIHDELLCQVPESMAEKFAEHLKSTMENTTRLSVPLRAEVGLGKTWDDAK